ncbi:hypothetical protein EV424DRAFT_1349490 [Suillus variegatus]|nr:hypothetical protein EV424DRAFT_1349490 [Suillus variegatus]
MSNIFGFELHEWFGDTILEFASIEMSYVKVAHVQPQFEDWISLLCDEYPKVSVRIIPGLHPLSQVCPIQDVLCAGNNSGNSDSNSGSNLGSILLLRRHVGGGGGGGDGEDDPTAELLV